MKISPEGVALFVGIGLIVTTIFTSVLTIIAMFLIAFMHH